jgi:signal transduction histidine kinase
MRAGMHRFYSPAQPTDPTQPPRQDGKLRNGLQGKLILTFAALVTISLACSCWLFATQSGQQISDSMGDQARQMAYTLSLASAPAYLHKNREELKQISNELLKTRNILYIAFYDDKQRQLTLAGRYASFAWANVNPITKDGELIPVAHAADEDPFGEHIDVFAQIKSKNDPAAPTMGYVVVGVSLENAEAMMSYVNLLVAGIGVAVLLMSLPVAYALVHGIFTPIRQFVEATQKMAGGRLDVKLDIHRNDLIGDLAVSFKDMVGQIRRKREELDNANGQLAEANDRLANANRDLEVKVQQRTHEYEAANARLTSEIAEKEDFLRAVSHDLNAPLRNIAGMASLLLVKHKEEFSEGVIHRLERIQKNVETETELISELLELSRIKTRRQKIELVDVEAIIRDLGGVFEEDLRSKEIQLLQETPLPALVGEKSRLRQVFQNLIDNAIKYMGSQTVREIRIGCIVRQDEAEFYVRDTGVGIEEGDVGRIFYVFRRGRGAAVNNVVGKGVGLAWVKSIIETYHGNIWVESMAGKGSTFRFSIGGQHIHNGGEVVEIPATDGDPDVNTEDPDPATGRRAA